MALHDSEFARRAVRVSEAPMASCCPDRSGQAAFIFYRGDQPPRP